jgi:hypothetical protein
VISVDHTIAGRKKIEERDICKFGIAFEGLGNKDLCSDDEVDAIINGVEPSTEGHDASPSVLDNSSSAIARPSRNGKWKSGAC